ncbi:MAG: hypothetical protein JST82_01265 [Bacteroidetes bacterium]|nr:hypothetical protein [Bacteroidota bacterium]
MQAEKFSTTEQRMLEQCLNGYGAKAECVRHTGIGYATIQKALQSGEATATVARKLRSYLWIQACASKVFIETAA